jgi:predicted ArsR family transcriptional regulator
MEDTKQKSKDQILHLLKMGGAQTATALAKQLQVSPMAIRQHLQHLQAKQLVTYREERRPLGRPVKLWELAEQSARQFPDSHADLMLEFLRGVEAVFGPEGLEKLVMERTRRQIQNYRTRLKEMGLADYQQQVRMIAHLRDQEGYMAEVVVQSEDTLLLIENHCPIWAAAQTCQGLCKAELEVFRAALGAMVTVERVEHILQGDRRCAYRIKQSFGGVQC